MNRFLSPATSLGIAFFRIVLLGAFCCATLCSPFSSASFAEDSLRQLRGSVRNPPDTFAQPQSNPQPRKDVHPHHHGNGEYDPDDGYSVEEVTGIGFLLGLGVTAPIWGPMTLMDDTYDWPGSFPRYPFEGDLSGHMWVDGWEPEGSSMWRTRARAEYGDNFGDLSYISGQLLVESTSRFGIDTEFFYRSEELSSGMTDDLWTGDFNFVFRFAQSERANMRAGVGLNWLVDEIDDSYGFNFTYGGDFFPAEPWVISADLDWGRLGGADLFHARTTVGIQYYGVEIYTGYDYLDVGGTQIDGFIAGLRFWF